MHARLLPVWLAEYTEDLETCTYMHILDNTGIQKYIIYISLWSLANKIFLLCASKPSPLLHVLFLLAWCTLFEVPCLSRTAWHIHVYAVMHIYSGSAALLLFCSLQLAKIPLSRYVIYTAQHIYTYTLPILPLSLPNRRLALPMGI
jgi:hypothetical protein